MLLITEENGVLSVFDDNKNLLYSVDYKGVEVENAPYGTFSVEGKWVTKIGDHIVTDPRVMRAFIGEYTPPPPPESIPKVESAEQ